jgi:hypothetical protein
LNPVRPLDLTVSISDVTGKVLKQERRSLTGPETICFSTDNLPGGFYNLLIEAEGITVQNKFLK